MKRFNRVKTFGAALLTLLCLASCNSAKGEEDITLDTDARVFNYTNYEFYGIRFQSTNKKFSYPHAAGAGGAEATNDEDWGYGGGGCCFSFSAKHTTPLSLKVVWAVLYDKAKYDANSGFDEYSTPKTRPGVVWCEAIVPIERPYPKKPSSLILEFYPDGNVKAHFVDRNNPQTSDPISFEEYANKLPTLPEGKYCKNEIPNPKYGLQRPKHFE